MAVVPMKRALVVGHEGDAAELTHALQRAGVIQIEEARLVASSGDPERSAVLRSEEERVEDELDDVRFVLDFLTAYRTAPQRPFASFITEKFHVGLDEFESIDRHLDVGRLLARCRELEAALAEVERESAPVERLIPELALWAWLDVPLSSLRGTAHTVALAFRGDIRSTHALAASIGEKALAAEASVLESTAIVIAHGSVADELRELARGLALVEMPLPPGEDVPAVEISRLEETRRRLVHRKAGFEREVAALTPLYPDVVTYLHYLENVRDRLDARRRFGATRHAAFIEGWVREDATTALAQALAPFRAVDITLVDPLPDETPPVEIRNPKWLQPFELLTRLYGMPAYGELDPTPFFAPFFALFFGITVGDVGYGLLLVIACWLMLTRLDIGENPKRFMRLVIYGGLAAIAFGVVTGGWFGVDIKDLPAALQGLVVLDPLNGAMAFLIFTAVLGVVQISWGFIIEAMDNVRHGDWQTAVREQATTLLVLVSGVVAFAGWIASTAAPTMPPALAVAYPISLKGLALGAAGVTFLGGDFFGPAVSAWRGAPDLRRWVDRLAGTALALAAVAWVLGIFGLELVGWRAFLLTAAVALLVSRTGRKMVVGALGGLYSLYGMSGLIGDVLSYTRLMALGLATVLIGSTVNLMAKMVFSAMPTWPAEPGAGSLIGFFLLFALVAVGGVLVLVVGHTFNVVINLLGSFVHPMRLQFVEFFGKFYEGSGRAFKPLTYTTDTLVLERSER